MKNRLPKYNLTSISFEEIVKGLEDELYQARRAILSLMPEKVQETLDSYYLCEIQEETRRWEHNTEKNIIGLAELLPQKTIYSSDRAYCPLCGEGSLSPYEEGFNIPEGLSRHLSGWGNNRQCEVFRATMDLARAYWNHKFSAEEE